jgi:hypothetical protein
MAHRHPRYSAPAETTGSLRKSRFIDPVALIPNYAIAGNQSLDFLRRYTLIAERSFG